MNEWMNDGPIAAAAAAAAKAERHGQTVPRQRDRPTERSAAGVCSHASTAAVAAVVVAG